MKHRIQIALAALLLAGLATGCDRPTIPPCISEDGHHAYGKWTAPEFLGVDGFGRRWYKSERTCETCGWTERSMGE